MIEDRFKTAINENMARFRNDEKFQSLMVMVDELKRKGVLGHPSYDLPMRDTIGRCDIVSEKFFK